MRLNYFSGLLLTFSFLALVDAGAQNLAVRKTDGSELIVSLSQIQRITFPGNNLALNYVSGSSDLFSLSLVGRIYFTTKTTGADVLEEPASTISVYPNPAKNYLNIANVSGATTIAIFRIDGSKVFEDKAEQGKTTIGISSLPAGMYLLKANNQVVKFIKQ
jgi:hypothetical protein